MPGENIRRKRRLSSFQIIILGFAGVILLGALAMLSVFCRDYGWRGIWMALFHSISAFCSAVKTAATILTMYLVLLFGGAVFISAYENLSLSACLYETASAVGTVGLTLGITPQLHITSQMVLIMLMYLGRVGGLTLIYAAFSGKKVTGAKMPKEKIMIG